MVYNLRAQGLEGDVLIVAPRDQNQLLIEASQARDGAGGRGGDGVVVIPDAVLLPHQLDPVLHAAEAPGDGPDILGADPVPYRQDGGHVVFHVMDAGQQDIGLIQDLLQGLPLAPDDAVPEKDALLRLRQPGELQHPAPGLGDKGMGDRVVPVQDQNVVRLLVEIQVLLGGHVLLHILVDIQVVGGEVGDDGGVGAVGEVHQLEGGQLQHHQIRGLHFVRLIQQRGADVAPQPDPEALLFQQLGDQRGGGGLPVGAGDGDDLRGADGEEGLHLGGDHRAGVPQGFDLRGIRVQARGAEHHVAGKAVQIALPQVKLRAVGFQPEDFGVQLLPGRLVAAGDVAPIAQQQPYQGAVADAHAQHQDPFVFQIVEEFFQPCHAVHHIFIVQI